MRGRGVGPGIAEGAEAGLPAGDRSQCVEQVPRRAGEAVKASNHEYIAGFEPVEHLGAARHLAEHLRASCLGKLAHLRIDALPVSRDPGVAVDRGRLMAVFYAKKKPSGINAESPLHNF